MIVQGTNLKVIDNTGARKAICIKVLGNGRKVARIGDVIVVSIKKCSKKSKVKPGSIYKSLVVRTKYPIKTKNSTYISFLDNSIILLNDKLDMLGTRINGLLSRNINIQCRRKIISSSRYSI
ncbi:uL14 family ribosomal protein [Candidatus Vidania fulgoroideae]|uniref:Large ribosomal subunit protein uL14 n=1 Tax=Candidatus Vidania fulgoroideorum TaxID=881286 RepID=A0A974X7K3_9PROT|nr:uL14 family ribosomal protein [Candidatus Vidania fulgoroideae]